MSIAFRRSCLEVPTLRTAIRWAPAAAHGALAAMCLSTLRCSSRLSACMREPGRALAFRVRYSVTPGRSAGAACFTHDDLSVTSE